MLLGALLTLGVACDKKPKSKTDNPEKKSPTTANTKSNPTPNQPTPTPTPTPSKPKGPKYSGPNADLKERLEKAYLEFHCLATTTKNTVEVATKQEAIYKKYGFTSALAYTDGILKLKQDTSYWRDLMHTAKTHCKKGAL